MNFHTRHAFSLDLSYHPHSPSHHNRREGLWFKVCHNCFCEMLFKLQFISSVLRFYNFIDGRSTQVPLQVCSFFTMKIIRLVSSIMKSFTIFHLRGEYSIDLSLYYIHGPKTWLLKQTNCLIVYNQGIFCLQNLSNGTLFEYSIQTEIKFTIY